MHRTRLSFFLLAFLASPCALAQLAAAPRPDVPIVESDGARGPQIDPPPVSFQSRCAADLDAWAPGGVFLLPWLDPAPMLAADAARGTVGTPLRAGVSRTLDAPLTCVTDGTWQTHADGSTTWRLVLVSPGAVATGVEFSRFQLPANTRVVVGGAVLDHAEAFEANGPNRRGSFAAAPVTGETVLIEYQATADTPELPVIEVSGVAHMYRSEAFGGPQAELPCQVDVMCRTVQANARDAVGRMLFPAGDGWYLCSGALLNDLDSNTHAAWFQTANHCINTQASADGLIVYWLFQTPSCGAAEPNPETKPKSYGGQLLFNAGDYDYAFLRLYEDVQDGQSMAGWTTAAPRGTVTGISHPGGSAKKYSAGPVTTGAPICGGLPLANFIYNDWLDGITEGGSSGSPLFDSNWKAVGPLFGICYFAPPDCTNPQDYNNVYGRFAGAYPTIGGYLVATNPDDAHEDNDVQSAAVLLGAGTFALRLVDLDDWFAVERCTSGPLSFKAYYTEAEMNLNLRVYDEAGGQIASSFETDGYEQIYINVAPGRYYARVARTTGWGGDYSLVIAGAAAATDCNGNGTPDACESGLCRGDIDGDGAVGQGDLARLLAAYGSSSGPGFDAAADVNCDGTIGQADLAIVLAEYGEACP